jgi:hypothetical protein
MKMQAKRILALIFLGVFFLYITPKEVYHAFTHHNDSSHTTLSDKDGLQISNEHHHCELLKIDQSFSAFNIEIPYHDFELKPAFYVSFNGLLLEENYTHQFSSTHYLRGPPSFI